MRPIVTDKSSVVCLSVCLSVGLSVTIMGSAKTAEAIEMPFGFWTRVGPRKHASDEDPDRPCEEAILRGKGRPTVKYRTLCGQLCKNG